jgi:hypothetical protein
MFKIRMSGIVSKQSILLLEKGLKRQYDSVLTLDFFCSYSDYEIFIGSDFTRFCNQKTGLTIKVEAKLIDVTQQWSISCDRISYGSRTLARIGFNDDNSITAIKKEMPVVHRWEDSSYDFFLIE